jgi:hypothetical protein
MASDDKKYFLAYLLLSHVRCVYHRTERFHGSSDGIGFTKLIELVFGHVPSFQSVHFAISTTAHRLLESYVQEDVQGLYWHG